MGQKKTTAKVFKNGQESPSDATLNEPVPRLIRMLACDCQKKNILCPISLLRPASIALLSWSSYTKEFVYLKTRLLAVPVLRQESFFGNSFQFFNENEPPKFTLSVSFDPLASLIKKNFSYTCLTSMPSRRFCVNKPSSTQAEFFNWTFFFFCWHVILGVRFPYNPNIYYACMFSFFSYQLFVWNSMKLLHA